MTCFCISSGYIFLFERFLQVPRISTFVELHRDDVLEVLLVVGSEIYLNDT